MTPEQLKASILQYAIQGKLVEQRPEEGTGEELYQQIQAEKQRLIKEKKIKKEKPLADITDNEIPFDIPETWVWIRVGDTGSWGSGATPSRTNPAYYGGSIPWLKTGDLNNGFIKEVPEYITELALEKTSVRLNPVGSVLMAMYGATIGKLGILEIPVTTNQACCACIPYAGMYNKYLFYYLMSMRKTYIGMAEGGAQPNISKEKIVNSILPLPPLAEQKRIVAKIEELLPYVDRYAAAYEKLEQFNAKFPEDMKKSILQYAIQGKLVEQRPEEGTGEELYRQIQAEKQRLIKESKIKKEKPLAEITEDEIPFDIPDSWKWVRLNDAVLSVADIDHKMPETVENNGYPYISPVNFTPTGIDYDNAKMVGKSDFEHLSKKCKPEKGDIVFPRYGTIGVVRMVDTDREFLVSYSCCTVKNMANLMHPQYVFYVLQSGMIKQEINRYINKTTQPNVGLQSIKQFLFPLPPLAEQKRIVAKLEEILPLCERLK
ncbi:restriction endonuclease subunit S [Fumia xinanensis]|uniref:Restriction endonuclease subunit S n=1 Tax=Fumia xinanensis TaxID=2763659 RepID=A0A926E620_9FIRM|nr:restriction endonuclease subunit S [Fumia xinanensis]MBC8560844.1 restriction endonuclease subunit S [Fumia xinanensis]